MILLTTVFAAIICTVIWYKNAPKAEMKVGLLCWMYWGATLMCWWMRSLATLSCRQSISHPHPLRCSMISIWGFPLLRWG